MPTITVPELLVTDFAGTTFRDDGAVVAAYKMALTSCQLAFTEDELRARRGASKLAVMEEFARRQYPADEARSIAREALEIFERALADAYQSGPVVEIAGAGDALGWLKDRRCAVALTTGLPRSLVDMLLDRLGWTETFDTTITGADVEVSRPAPFMIYRAMLDLDIHDVRRVAIIGDTPLDLQAGMNAGAGWVIGVLSGAHGIETLGATEHTHIIPSIAALPALFGAR